MAKYRQLFTSFWKDVFISELTPEDKLFYLYIMSNVETTQCGIYPFIVKFAAIDMGYSNETVEKLISRFVEYGKIKYCQETKEILIINWMKYNFLNSKTVISCVNKELKQVKSKELLKEFYEICITNKFNVEVIFDDIDIESIGYAYGMHRVSIPQGEEEEKEENRKEAEIEEAFKAADAENTKLKESFKKVISYFNNNIHPITPIEYEKISDWCMDIEFGVVILAIEEAVKHNARTFVYIERVLNNWYDLGYRTVEGVNAYKRDYKKPKVIPNAGAYRLLDGED